MKKAVSLVVVLVLVFGCSVMALADFVPMPPNPEAYDPEYIPAIPDFIQQHTPSPDGSIFDSTLDIDANWSANSAEQTFWNNFYTTDAPYLVLLSQGAYNKYKEDNGIDYDREYSVYMLKYKSSSSSPYSFGSFAHFGGPRHRTVMNDGNTMEFMPLQNSFDVIVLRHDKERNVWAASSLIKNTSMQIKFTYVLASPPLSGKPFMQGNFEMYPYHSEIKGKTFEVGGYAEGGAPDGNAYLCHRDYDWWLYIQGGDTPPVTPPYDPDKDLDKDTNGDGKPDINIDTDGNGKADTNIDTDGDGKPDINIDTNGDGKPEINIETNGDKKPDINIDTNGDNKPDINIDTNGDGKPDINIDTNGDKKPDINIDTNGDNRPDINIDTNGDKKPDINIDTNGDNKPDINIDTDGDDKADTNIDTDGDGIPDTNVRPGGSGPPDGWWDNDNSSGSDLPYNSWNFFDPFKFMYEPFEWDNSYDPLEGYTPPSMPELPGASVPPFNGYDPFDIPNDTPFQNYVDQIGGK